MNELHDKAIRKGMHIWWRYVRFCQTFDLKWRADLCRANLREVNLREADLYRADLRGANLCRADLRGANLCRADLREVNLREVNLREADLREVNLCGADLCGAVGIPKMACPETGSFEAWKKCKDGIIVKLFIPADARRSSATGRKCRATCVDVLEVIDAEVGVSQHDGKTEYRAGQRVNCDQWDDNRWNECSGGIHFFMTREEAEAY